MTIKAVNWNRIIDSLDLDVWNRVTANFWLPEKIAISNDLASWSTLTAEEKDVVRKVFAGLTLLDTIQSRYGAVTMMDFAETQHEEAVYANFSFMEAVHAKSYSSIFSTLCSTKEIDDVFRWVEEEVLLQGKADLIKKHYGEKSIVAMAASVLLESFLFYSGFYVPFYFASQGKLTNTATIIRLILRDEGVHGYYIGQKFAKLRSKMSPEEQVVIDREVQELFDSLMEIEVRFTRSLYDDLGWTENVMMYVRYNANKALQNLGYDAVFPPEKTTVEATILSSMMVDANETHDFFSDQGASYVMGKAEETTDDDWE